MLMINSRDVNIVFFLKIDCRLPKIDFFLNYRLLWRHNGPLSSAVKLGLLGGERSLPDRRASGGNERSANGDVDRNSISVVSSAITGGSRHAWTTQEYLDKTDHADRRRYSCDVIKTVRVTEATRSATWKAIATVVFRGHAGHRAISCYASFAAFNKANWNFADVFFTLFRFHFCILDLREF